MNGDKTKLVKFSRRKQRQGIKQETFDFLGFTFYIGKSRKGYYLVKLKTVGKRFSLKLKKTNDWTRSIGNKTSMKHIMKTASAKLRGHIQYYGVSHNSKAVENFVYEVGSEWASRYTEDCKAQEASRAQQPSALAECGMFPSAPPPLKGVLRRRANTPPLTPRNGVTSRRVASRPYTIDVAGLFLIYWPSFPSNATSSPRYALKQRSP